MVRMVRFEEQQAQELADRRLLRRALTVAALAHAVLLSLALPRWESNEPVAEVRQAYVARNVRLRAPQRPRAVTSPPQAQPEARKVVIPVPDPTPDEPEPELPEPVPEVAEAVAAVETAGDVVTTPEGPGDSTGEDPRTVDGQVPSEIGGDVSAPVKLFGPAPPYTEEARLARTEGVVLVRALVDTRGTVVDVEVLRGLPNGLTDTTIATVMTWRFRPALRAGEAVPVYYFLTVSFRVL
jgi:protein TonB